MSGGGGSSKKKKEAEKVGTEPYANAPVAQTMQPTLPGFEGMLASQLQQGFSSGGAGVPDFEAMLSSMYQPMTTYDFKEPISVTAEAYDKSKFAPIKTGNATLDKLLMGGGAVDVKSGGKSGSSGKSFQSTSGSGKGYHIERVGSRGFPRLVRH